jgi:hypothetical protein
MRKSMLVAVLCASVLTLSTLPVRAATSTNEFDVVLVVASPTTWESIKYNTGSGEAWIAQAGKWMPIEDKTKIPQGKYSVKMMALTGDWAAIRLEVTTGKSWQCRAGAWMEMTHATADSINSAPTVEKTRAPAAPIYPPTDPKLFDEGKKKQP